MATAPETMAFSRLICPSEDMACGARASLVSPDTNPLPSKGVASLSKKRAFPSSVVQAYCIGTCGLSGGARPWTSETVHSTKSRRSLNTLFLDAMTSVVVVAADPLSSYW